MLFLLYLFFFSIYNRTLQLLIPSVPILLRFFCSVSVKGLPTPPRHHRFRRRFHPTPKFFRPAFSLNFNSFPALNKIRQIKSLDCSDFFLRGFCPVRSIPHVSPEVLVQVIAFLVIVEASALTKGKLGS